VVEGELQQAVRAVNIELPADVVTVISPPPIRVGISLQAGRRAGSVLIWILGFLERGPTGYLAIIAMMRGGFPDIQWTLEEMIAEEDKVAARFTMRGTHDGAFFRVPPTGEKIAVQAMNFYRLADGEIVGERGQPDLLGLLQQIGAAPRA
jgi:predicted ester cyclase